MNDERGIRVTMPLACWLSVMTRDNESHERHCADCPRGEDHPYSHGYWDRIVGLGDAENIGDEWLYYCDEHARERGCPFVDAETE